MRRTSAGLRGWSAALAAGALACAAVGVVGLTQSAHAAPAVTAPAVTIICQTQQFPEYDWEVEVTAEAVSNSGTTQVSLSFNDLVKSDGSGVSPVPMTDSEMSLFVDATAGGTAFELVGTRTSSVPANGPVPMATVVGNVASSTPTIDLVVTRFEFDIFVPQFNLTMKTLCGPSGAAVQVPINAVPVEGVTTLPTSTATPTKQPTTTATPTSKPTATSTPKPTATEDGDATGTPATGKVAFSCVLQTLGSPFDYEPKVTVSGSRPTADSDQVTVKASFSNIPGLAPLPIEDNTMDITVQATIGGKKVTFTDSSKVNAAAYAEVPVPTLTKVITTKESELDVAITGFKFDFGTISGLEVFSECTLANSGKLGTMKVGVGDDGSDDDGTTDAPGTGTGSNGGGANPSGPSAATLPKTGPGAPLAVIGLWASAFLLLSVALLVAFPRRSKH